MKIAAHIVATLFGLIFLAGGLFFFFGTLPPAPPEDSLPGKFMAAFGPTGYMAFVKVCEIMGGALVIVPKTRNLGLLILGPIVINILCFHGFVAKGFWNPAHAFITVAALVNRPADPTVSQ
ncbi:MAG: DoxX family protein [Limisphaerales bacterium]